MVRSLSIVTDDADLAVELAQVAEQLGLALAPRVSAAPFDEAGDPDAVLVVEAPTPERIVALARRPRPPILGFVGATRDDLVGLGEDVGLPVFRETRPLVSAAVMRSLEAPAWGAQTRSLPRAVRVRLDRRGWSLDRHGGKLVMLDGGLVGWRADDGPPVALGFAPDVAEAGGTIQKSLSGAVPGHASVEGVDRAAVRDVLFGPARALSDPASKSALEPYGVPLPIEELCSSPSRAAAEAARLGFPVKLSLASPDLRVWDHPDLQLLGASSSTAVRDGFRLITTMAAEREPSARLLGVYVTSESAAWLRLRLELRAVPTGWALAQIGRSDDPSRTTLAALPTSSDRARRTLERIGISAPRARADVEGIIDALNRLAVFVVDQSDAITDVRIDPFAALVGGGAEVREVCVNVGDVFEKTLELE